MSHSNSMHVAQFNNHTKRLFFITVIRDDVADGTLGGSDAQTGDNNQGALQAATGSPAAIGGVAAAAVGAAAGNTTILCFA